MAAGQSQQAGLRPQASMRTSVTASARSGGVCGKRQSPRLSGCSASSGSTAKRPDDSAAAKASNQRSTPSQAPVGGQEGGAGL